MEKKIHFWLFISLLSFSLNHLFANNTIPSNKTEELSDCKLPLPDSFRIAGLGSGYVSLAWNPNNFGDDYLLTTFQENNNGGFDSIHAILVYDVDTHTINNLSSPKAYKFRIQPVCPDGQVNTNVSAFTPPVVFILELTTNGVSPNIYQYVPCENIPIPKKPTDWIGFQLFDLSTNSSAMFQYEAVPNAGGKIKRITMLGENQILVSANEENKWPNNNSVTTFDMNFKVGKTAGPDNLEFFERLSVNIHDNYVDICEYANWTRPGFTYFTMKGTIGGNPGKIKPQSEPINIKVQNPINKSIKVFFEGSLHQEDFVQLELRTISGNLIQTSKEQIYNQNINIEFKESISSGVYFLTIKWNEKLQNFKVIVLND